MTILTMGHRRTLRIESAKWARSPSSIQIRILTQWTMSVTMNLLNSRNRRRWHEVPTRWKQSTKQRRMGHLQVKRKRSSKSLSLSRYKRTKKKMRMKRSILYSSLSNSNTAMSARWSSLLGPSTASLATCASPRSTITAPGLAIVLASATKQGTSSTFYSSSFRCWQRLA